MNDVLHTEKSGFIIVEKEYAVNIDDELDWLYAEALIKLLFLKQKSAYDIWNKKW